MTVMVLKVILMQSVLFAGNNSPPQKSFNAILFNSMPKALCRQNSFNFTTQKIGAQTDVGR
jgi:hypothetical protein